MLLKSLTTYKLDQFSYSFYRFFPADSNKDKCSIIIEIYYSLEISLVHTYKPQAADFFESSGNVLKQLDRKKLKKLCLDRLKDKTIQCLMNDT